MVLTDLFEALDKLDANDVVPLIFCEACDLVKLPSLLPSSNLPISESKEVLSSIKSLSSELKVQVTASTNELKKKLDSLQSDLKGLESAVSTSLAISKESTKESSVASNTQLAPPRPHHIPALHVPPNIDRSMNIVLFGLP